MTDSIPQEAASLPPYAIVVVNFNSSALLEAGAAGLSSPDGGRLVVVDCFSSLKERAQVSRLAQLHGWQAVLLDTNEGFGGGTNAGASAAFAAGAEVLVALNPDATIDPASIATLVRSAADDPMLLASPRIETASGTTWFDGADLYLADGRTRSRAARAKEPDAKRREWATGACFAVSKTLWDAVGGFDDEYFLYWEDIDFSHRVLDAGGRLATVDAVAVHDAGGTQERASGTRSLSETYYYYNIRNRMLYAVKHLDDDGVRAWQSSSARVARGVILRGGKPQLLRSLAPWRAYVKGLAEGRRISREHLRSGAKLGGKG